MTTQDAIRGFIISELRFAGSAEELTDDYPLLEREVVDSVGIFSIVGFLSSDLDAELDDEDLVAENFVDISAISRIVELRRG